MGGEAVTKYAKQILNIVNQSKRHMTAEQIFLELKKTEPRVVQATVYFITLRLLYKCRRI